MSAVFTPLSRLSPAVPLLLRLVLGTIMATHGWQKLTMMGPANFGGEMLGGLGIPAPVFFGYVVTFTELIGGAFLLVGLLTRISALLLTVILTVATIMVKVDIGLIAPMGAPLPGAELDLALIVGLLALIILGPGRASLDHVLRLDPQPATFATAAAPPVSQHGVKDMH
jgi:putative oxidoreductase